MSFLIVSWRRLVKEKLYALVCVLSLALGITGSILISLYLLSELTFDHHHQNYQNIYRVTTTLGDTSIAQSGFEVGPLLVREFPQYLDVVRFRDFFEETFEFGDSSNEWEDVFLADPSVFDVFTIIPVRGDIDTVFTDRYSIAISESFAEYYFDDRDPIGEVLSTDLQEFRVTLVFEDLPENVTQQFDALLPFDLLEVYRPEIQDSAGDRFISNYSTFLLVSDNFDAQSITSDSEYLMQNYMETNLGAEIGRLELVLTHNLQNLGELHFSEGLIAAENTGNIVNLYIFSAVVLALLFSSCINYVNIATARAATRVREVSIKKLLGASGQKLILQFLSESIFFVGLSFIAAIAISVTLIEIGIIEEFTGKAELGNLLLAPERFPLIVLAWLLIGVLAGIYPAVKLSEPSMTTIMGSENGTIRHGLPLRQILVWSQITVAITIIAAVFVMMRQSEFLLQSPLGFDKTNRLVVRLQGADEIRGRNALMNELRQHNEVLNVAVTNGSIGRTRSVAILPVESTTGERQNLTMNSTTGGEYYLDTMGMELVQGNQFRDQPVDSEGPKVLVNETLVREMEWTQPIGMQLGQSEVIGVVRDFHYRPQHEPIAPLFVAQFNEGFLNNLDPGREQTVGVDLIIHHSGNDEAGVRAFIVEVVDRFSDQPIIDVQSLETIWNRSYEDDTRTIGVVAIFAGLSIVISLMGLGGLAAYNNQRRSREVAIRKVLGASVPNILGLLSTDMIKVLLLAVIPACFGAWYLSDLWLERFAYRTGFSASPFILAFVTVCACSMALVILQTYHVARSNPVDKLKYE